MGDLSTHFDRKEFACRGLCCCGNVAPVSERLVAALELLRALANLEVEHGEVKFHIDSGFRCRTHNKAVGGHPSSLHMEGSAADVRPEGISVLKLVSLVKQVPDFASGGVGVYEGFVHLDVRRSGPARW